MWHSSRGNRTLCGAEARLVAAAIEMMIDGLMVHVDDDIVEPVLPDCDSGITVYDRLNACQRVGLLNQLAQYLLTETVSPLKLSATAEAGVAAIYIEIRDQVAIELGLFDELTTDESHHWRCLVNEALHESLSETELVELELDLGARCDHLEFWEDVVDILCSGILWDRDFEMVDSFLDEDPGLSDHRRQLLGIDRDYFIDIAPDPTPDVARMLIRETRDLLRMVR